MGGEEDPETCLPRVLSKEEDLRVATAEQLENTLLENGVEKSEIPENRWARIMKLRSLELGFDGGKAPE